MEVGYVVIESVRLRCRDHEVCMLGEASPLGPSIDGIGLRRAFELGTRGTPWMTRGSFISVGSSFAGTITMLA